MTNQLTQEKNTTNSYYAKFYFEQDGNHSSSHVDLTFEGDAPTRFDLVNYIVDNIEGYVLENQNEDWEEKGEEDIYVPDTYGMTAMEFAISLVENEQEWKDKGVIWEIATNLEKIEDPENWEHPCNL